MSTWIILGLAWFALGVLCYGAILRFFPPMPLIDNRPQDAIAEEDEGRPFSIRDLPQIAVFLVPMALVSPVLLVVFLCQRSRHPKKPQ